MRINSLNHKIKSTLYFISGLILITLFGCGLQITERIGTELNPSVLYEVYNTKPTNLANLSKCSLAPTIKIVNAEQRNTDLIIGTAREGSDLDPRIIRLRDVNDYIVKYLSDAYLKSGVRIDEGSPKVIELSILSAELKTGPFYVRSSIQLKVNVPEKGIVETISASDQTSSSGNASARVMAYAMHQAVWNIINDKSIQDYILCK